MIKIENLIIGKTYEGEGRNFQKGIWNGTSFIGMRYKYGSYFEDEEDHWDSDDVHGTFKPFKQID